MHNHYGQSYTWIVTGWYKIANTYALDEKCYPSYLYRFTPSLITQHEVVCDSAGNNRVTIYGLLKREETPSQRYRRLNTDALELSPILIVDSKLKKANCTIQEGGTANSSEDVMVCSMNCEIYFQFFLTTTLEKTDNAKVLIEYSKLMYIIKCTNLSLK